MVCTTDNDDRGRLVLGIIRIVLGFMMVWAFFDKLLGLGMLTTPENAIVNGGSPTAYYLSELVSGPFEGLFNAIAGNAVVDFLLMAGLIAIGVAMMLGIASRLSTVGMVVMMVLMYMLCIPPSDNPLVDYHIVYALAALAVFYLGGYRALGLQDRWEGIGMVKRIPMLR